MAITFPLGAPTFWDGLRIASLSFRLGEAMSVSETGGGEVLAARMGTRLWSGEARIPPAEDQDQTLALIDLIRQPGAPFMVYDRRREFAQADPDGAIQGAAVCRVASVASNAREMTLTDLPSGYVLTPGDHLSISYGSSPIRYFLARVVTGGTFVGAPAQVTVEVVPGIPEAVAADDVVRLIQPICKAVYVPDSFSGVSRDLVLDSGFSFKWRQTLR
ncbi:hypothetical protein [Mameliella alba]|uniref:hypothetical protein n=1 Tax=Mameliella alba TaxID=561184 RepID=UPI000B52D62A|nr:hypothetical protein [Mameliella alba]OWV40383.1 hypothetical protein CDZ95_21385 [Mameliella alba]